MGERTITKEAKEIFAQFRPKREALVYPLVFFLRRYSAIIVLTVPTESMLAQIHLHMFLTGFVVYYLISFAPYYEPKQNRLETFNELTVLLASYPLLMFTGVVGDQDREDEIGWALICCILLNILANMIVAFVSIFLLA